MCTRLYGYKYMYVHVCVCVRTHVHVCMSLFLSTFLGGWRGAQGSVLYSRVLVRNKATKIPRIIQEIKQLQQYKCCLQPLSLEGGGGGGEAVSKTLAMKNIPWPPFILFLIAVMGF